METPSHLDPNQPSRSVRRRAFLRASGAAAATFVLPPTLRAFDLGRPSPLRDGSVLGERLSEAREVGKPLLIFVIPEDDEERWARGRRLGHWLNVVEDVDSLIRFSMCVIVCASLATIRRRVQITGTIQDPWLIVTDPSTKRRPLEGRSIAGPNARWIIANRPRWNPDPDEEARIAAEEALEAASEQAQLAELNHALRIAIEADAEAFDRLVEINRGRLTPRQRSAIRRGAENGDEIDDATIHRGAATLIDTLRRKPTSVNRDTELMGQLAEYSKDRLRTAPPAGARWARSTPCGSRLERDDGSLEPRTSLGGCGLGHVPRLGHRFLQLVVEQH